MATSAEVTGFKIPDTAAEDSVSLLEVMKDSMIVKPLHEAVICHSGNGLFVVRKGKWKLLYCPGSGGRSNPTDAVAKKQGLSKWQLYDLDADPKEQNNVIVEHQGKVTELTTILRKYVENGRSTPGAQQENDKGQNWWKQLPWEKPAQ